MNIADLKIARVIAHEVVRASKLTEHPPVLSDELVTLDAKGKDLVGKRLVSTVASGSHCVDVTVDDATTGSPFDHATSMLDQSEAEFIETSKHLAGSLSNAQTAGPIKSGSAIFVSGACAADGNQVRFIAIIKADSDQALAKRVKGENITLTYVNDMLLGESQRLIKIALFIEDSPEVDSDGEKPRKPEDFSIKVFDHLMQASGDADAAAYFYATFLKCKLAHNASRQTKQFFQAIGEFIDGMNAPQETKVDLRGDVIAYFRGNRTVLEPRTFAKDVLPATEHDPFLRYCRDTGITQAISKDLALLKGRLRRQSVKFSSNVTLYAPPEAFRDSVKITGISSDGWTELKIRGSIESMP